MRFFKSPWFYWHTGHKLIAVVSMMISTMLMWLAFGFTVGFSIWGIITAVLLDVLGLWLVVLYFLIIRAKLPEFLHFREQVDQVICLQLIAPISIGFFVGRIVSFLVAKLSGYPFKSSV